jgi:hypothetical protein
MSVDYRSVAATGFGCLLLMGCASNPAKKASVDPGQQQQIKAAGVAILTDACHYHATAGRSRFVESESRQIAADLLGATETAVARHGIAVEKRLTPFICGNLSNSKLNSFWLANTREGKAAKARSWPVINREANLHIDDSHELAQLYRVASPVLVTESGAEYTPFILLGPTAPFSLTKMMSTQKEAQQEAEQQSLTSEQLATLKTELEAPYALLVTETSYSRSAGLAVTNGLAEGLLLPCLLFGSPASETCGNERIRPIRTAALVDLNNGKVVWEDLHYLQTKDQDHSVSTMIRDMFQP